MSASLERVLAVHDLEQGRPVGVELADGEQVCLVRVGGEIFAFANQCTHAEFPMSDGEMVDDYVIECCLHGAQFDVRDGKVLEAPADDPLPMFEIEVKDGEVWVRRRRP